MPGRSRLRGFNRRTWKPFQQRFRDQLQRCALSPDNTRLFESNQLSNSVNSFTVKADGSLTNIGSFGGTGFFHTLPEWQPINPEFPVRSGRSVRNSCVTN